tara:strand:- start:56 stop:1318 length:1263 start_codon:yes stop_codon:yes gene_type:complete
MFKIIKFFLVILVILLPIIWLSNYPGQVKILWNNYFVETSMFFLLILLVVLFSLVITLTLVYKKITSIPKEYKSTKNLKLLSQSNKVLTELTKSIVTNDIKKIDSNARKLKKYLGNSVFTSYILSKNSLLKNDLAEAKKYNELLIKIPEAKFLGMKGLSIIYIKEKDDKNAIKYLEQAFKLQPKNLWIRENLSRLLAKNSKWKEAAQILEDAKANNERMTNNRASFLVKSGASPENIWKDFKNFIPVISDSIKFYVDNNEEKKAIKILEGSWNNLLYLGLVKQFFSSKKDDVKLYLRRYKLLKKSLIKFINHDETKLAIAYGAYKASLWGETKNYLEKIKVEDWDQRIIDLWKKLEEKSSRIVIPTLPKSPIKAPEWNCVCGKSYSRWQLICDKCNEIGKIYWPKSINIDLNEINSNEFF